MKQQPRRSSARDPKLIWMDGDLVIENSCDSIERDLFYTQKEIVETEGGNKVQTTKMPMFRVAQEQDPRIITTWHGFLGRVCQVCKKEGISYTTEDRREPFPAPNLRLMKGFKPGQYKFLVEGLIQGRSGLFKAPTRYGKCFGAGTPVMMADGSVKAVENIVDGDLVMGHDSTPRRVIGCIKGYGKMFQVRPNYHGMTWCCNEDHILHLVRTNEGGKWAKVGQMENVTVKEWRASTVWFRHIRKMRKVAVDFRRRHLDMDPYVYGVWLGNGHSNTVAFTNPDDSEIWTHLDKWANNVGLVRSDYTAVCGKGLSVFYVLHKGTGSVKRGTNKIRQWFKSRPKVKGIDKDFLLSDRSDRLQLLAGLIDTDGALNNGTNLEISTEHEQMAKDIVFLCNTLGFPACYSSSFKSCQTGASSIYHRVKIRGEVDIIPLRVRHKACVRKNKFNALRTGFDIQPIGDDHYYGFELEGKDRLFLLGDCTVVHNTYLIANTLRAFPGVKTVIAMPGVDLLSQQIEDFRKLLPGREIRGIFSGAKGSKEQSEDITVVSFDSMDKVDHDSTRLVIVDEPHAAVSAERLIDMAKFKRARIYGFGATLEGRFDGRDDLIVGLIGPVLVEKTFREAVTEGNICNIIVYVVKVPFRDFTPYNRLMAYRHLLLCSSEISNMVGFLCNTVIPANYQTLVFISEQKQADRVQRYINGGQVAIAQRMKKKQRDEMFAKMVSGEVTRCLATSIYSQGVTFPNIRCIINLAAGGGSITGVQKPGRLAQVRPGKKAGYMIDFIFECSRAQKSGGGSMTGDDDMGEEKMPWRYWRMVENDGRSRVAVYKSMGYEVRYVNSLDEIRID